MVNTKLDIHICGPTSVFHFDPHPPDAFFFPFCAACHGFLFAIFRGKAEGFSNFSAAEFRAQHAFQARDVAKRALGDSWNIPGICIIYIYNIYIYIPNHPNLIYQVPMILRDISSYIGEL